MKTFCARSSFALLLVVTTITVVHGLLPSCGVRKVQYNNLILGGQKATVAGRWPWHAVITHRAQNDFQLACGGSVIDKYTILTAAHCLHTPNGVISPRNVLVHLGRVQMSMVDSKSRSYAPDHFIIHPEYEQGNVRHDIGLIKLTEEIEMSAYIQPVCLWSPKNMSGSIVGRKAFVVGFGLNDADEVSDYLLEAEVPVVDLWNCFESNRGAFGAHLGPTMLCAGARNSVGPCNGDSGGGLVLRTDNVWYIRGIVSFAPTLDDVAKCDPREYTVYTDVSKYLDWITNPYENDGTDDPVKTDGASNGRRAKINPNGCGVESLEYVRARSDEGLFAFPWATTIEYVGIAYRRANECHAYLVSEWHLLTAASCIQDVEENDQEIFVRLGNFNVSGRFNPQIRYVEKIIVHRRYDNTRYANDIALLKLRKKANIDDGQVVNVICLPTGSEESTAPAEYWLQGRRKFFPRFESWVIRVTKPELCQMEYTTEAVRLPTDGSYICTVKKTSDKNTHSLVALAAMVGVDEQNRKNTLIGFLPKMAPSSDYQAFVNIGFYLDWINRNLII